MCLCAPAPCCCCSRTNDADTVPVAETVQAFITTMDALKLGMTAVDQVRYSEHTLHGALVHDTHGPLGCPDGGSIGCSVQGSWAHGQRQRRGAVRMWLRHCHPA